MCFEINAKNKICIFRLLIHCKSIEYLLHYECRAIPREKSFNIPTYFFSIETMFFGGYKLNANKV